MPSGRERRGEKGRGARGIGEGNPIYFYLNIDQNNTMAAREASLSLNYNNNHNLSLGHREPARIERAANSIIIIIIVAIPQPPLHRHCLLIKPVHSHSLTLSPARSLVLTGS